MPNKSVTLFGAIRYEYEKPQRKMQARDVLAAPCASFCVPERPMPTKRCFKHSNSSCMGVYNAITHLQKAHRFIYRRFLVT